MKIFDRTVRMEYIEGDKTAFTVEERLTESYGFDHDGSTEPWLVVTLESYYITALDHLCAAAKHGLFSPDTAIEKIIFDALCGARLLLDVCNALGGALDNPAEVCGFCQHTECRNAGKRATAIIASRHPATVTFLERWFAEKNMKTVALSSVKPEDITGRIVAGNLPAHLAKLCKMYIAVELPTGCPRGEELGSDYIEANAKLMAYDVSFIGEAVYLC